MDLLPEQKETLRQLSELWRDTPFVLIGHATWTGASRGQHDYLQEREQSPWM